MMLLRKFLKSRSGNFATTFALLLLPLLFAVGFAVDYSRYSSMRSHLQELTDAGVLALAASENESQNDLRTMAERVIAANRDMDRAVTLEVMGLDTTDTDVELRLRATIPTTFMALANYTTLTAETRARALRPTPPGAVEVALILDNTFSMSSVDPGGVRKMDALKRSATTLVDELMGETDRKIRIALVPYAEYVNVGLQNRNASWIEGAADREDVINTTTSCSPSESDPLCKDNCRNYPGQTYSYCSDPAYEIREQIYYKDGIPTTQTYYVQTGCNAYSEYSYAAYQVCYKPYSYTNAYKWRGCVYSRTDGSSVNGTSNTYRLHEKNSSIKYKAIVERDYLDRCLTPLTELTSDKTKINQAISDMVYEKYGYEPNTYIPGGLIWGLNVLSPEEPFLGAEVYDDQNISPRKVAVLMTDGENTMLFNSNGSHSYQSPPTSSGYPDNASAVTAYGVTMTRTNNDTVEICRYMREEKKIEIFTISFMVNIPWARDMLQECASSPDHYFDAGNAEALRQAFSRISQSLRNVRLVE